MENFLELLAKNYGILGLILAGVVAYFLRAETVFWKEREDYKRQLQANHENFISIMKERISEQQAAVVALVGQIDKIEERLHKAEVEFYELRGLITLKLEQMQQLQMQRLTNGTGQIKG